MAWWRRLGVLSLELAYAQGFDPASSRNVKYLQGLHRSLSLWSTGDPSFLELYKCTASREWPRPFVACRAIYYGGLDEGIVQWKISMSSSLWKSFYSQCLAQPAVMSILQLHVKCLQSIAIWRDIHKCVGSHKMAFFSFRHFTTKLSLTSLIFDIQIDRDGRLSGDLNCISTIPSRSSILNLVWSHSNFGVSQFNAKSISRSQQRSPIPYQNHQLFTSNCPNKCTRTCKFRRVCGTLCYFWDSISSSECDYMEWNRL